MRSFLKKQHASFYKMLGSFLQKFKMEAYALIFIEMVVGAVVSVSAFLLFLEFAEEVLEPGGISLDVIISHFIYALRSPLVTEIMRGFSFLGGEFIFFISLCIWLGLMLRGYKREGIVFAVAIGGGQILNYVIKAILQVPRPTIDPIALANFYSFPSGHAMNSFIFFASITYLVFHFTRKKRLSVLCAIVSGILVALIGFSRVYLGVHYPSDIIAGFVAGFWWFITVIFLDKTLHFYRLFRDSKH